MANFEERVFISEFNILPMGTINVRKTTEILKDGEVISQTYWRCSLRPDSLDIASVLNEQYYFDIANYAWSKPSPQPYDPNPRQVP